MQVKKQPNMVPVWNWTWNRLVPNWERLYVKAAYLTYAEHIVKNARLDEAQAGV